MLTLVALLVEVTLPAPLDWVLTGPGNASGRHITRSIRPRRSSASGVNNIGHQNMVPFDTGGSSYSLIHLLQRAQPAARRSRMC